MEPQQDLPSANRIGSDTNNFTALRLLLAIMVIVGHSPELIDGDRHREVLTSFFHTKSLGEVAVMGFFIISGFLITQSWERSRGLVVFVQKRIARIYPGFLLAAVISGLVVGPLGAKSAAYFAAVNYGVFVRSLFFLHLDGLPPTFVGMPWAYVNGPLWSIPYEFICYLLLGMFGIAKMLCHRRIVVGLFVCVTLLWLMSDRFEVSSPTIHTWFQKFESLTLIAPDVLLRCLACFLAGVSYYLYKPFWNGNVYILWLCGVVLFFCMFHGKAGSLAIVTVGAYLLFTVAFSNNSVLGRLSRLPDMSYGVYLYAWPIQKLLLWHLPRLSPWTLTALTVPLALLCGLISYRFVEQPCLRWKQRSVQSAKPI